MRTEQEMYDLIMNTAKEDERIRAVYMNGSRTNVNAPKDIFQDYDIVYAVTETRPFYEDKSWIDRFGERLYMQCPDEYDKSMGLEVDFEKCYGWLIQFADGNRLDLHVEPLDKLDILDDKLCRILLDKDGILPDIPEATDVDYHIKKPSEAEYLAACNEFWWCLNNVAKGLWRNELPFVHDMLNGIVRPQLVKILSWKIGNETDFSVSVGKSAKYMYRWLEPTVWERFLQTYGGTTAEQVWNSVMIMCGLMDEIAPEVGEKLGFQYNNTEAKNSRYYLEQVRNLPANATQIFPCHCTSDEKGIAPGALYEKHGFIEDALVEAMGYPNQEYILHPAGSERCERQKTINKMIHEISSILSDCEPSIYLYGSSVLDDFRLGWSDIDLLVLTNRQISEEQAQKLVNLRQTMLEKEPGNPYYRSFEGGMLTLDAFLSRSSDRVVYWGTSGERITDTYMFDSFGMAELMESGVLLYGRDVRSRLIAPDVSDLYADIKHHYEAIRKYVQKTERNLYSFGWMLDIARCLYTLRTGKIIAKTAAAEWALENNLCPVPDVLKTALQVRKAPLEYKNHKQTLDYAESLADPIQSFADVLEDELKRL